MTTHSLDLGVGDVHVDSVDGGKKARKMGSKQKLGALALNKKKKKLGGAQVAPKKSAAKVRVRADIAAGGSLHVRHMSDARGELATLGVIELNATEMAASDGSKPVWIQLAKPGSFKGHAAGPFALTAQVFDQILANYQATTNRRIPIDFNHASEQDPTSGSLPTEGAPAQGWIVDMKISGGNLWGLVEWGERARQYIREGGYKFFSPAIRFNSRDRVTGQPVGARMSSGALTNDPFLDGLVPVAASNAPRFGVVKLAAISHPSEALPGIRRALNLSDMASVAECSEEFGRLNDAVDEGDGDDVHGMPVRARLSALRDEMRAPHTQDRDEFLAQVQALIDDAGDSDDNENESGDLTPEIDPTDSSGEPAQLDADDGAEEADMTATDTQVTTLSAQVAETTLKLSAANAKVLEHEATIVARDATLKALTDEKTKRDDADLSADVDATILTWGARKGIDETSKPHLLSFRKSDPAGFAALYPVESARAPQVQRLLSGSVTPLVAREGVEAEVVTLSRIEGESTAATTDRVRGAFPKLSTQGVYNMAAKIRKG